MKYYKYNTIQEAQEASGSRYELNAPPRSERSTLYAYIILPNSRNDTYVMDWVDLGNETGRILDSLAFLTSEEAIAEGYLISDY